MSCVALVVSRLPGSRLTGPVRLAARQGRRPGGFPHAEGLVRGDASAAGLKTCEYVAEGGVQLAAYPGEPQAGRADTISVEPTPTGYRTMGRMFRDELDRVQRLRRRLGPLLHLSDGETTDEGGELS